MFSNHVEDEKTISPVFADWQLESSDEEEALRFYHGLSGDEEIVTSMVPAEQTHHDDDLAEIIPENDAYRAYESDDEIDLEKLLEKMQVKTRVAKILLFYVTAFSVIAPLLFITSAIQFPAQFEEFLTSLKELLWFTCRFTSEDIEAIAFDGTVVRLEAIRYSTTTAFATIFIGTIGAIYQGGKKCWKRGLTNELIELLEERHVQNAHILRSYEFSSAKMRYIIQSIRENGVRRELLEEIRENPARLERMARNLQSYRQELMRYTKFLIVCFTVPGLIIWMQKADSLATKIDCDKSTVLLDTCPAEKQYAHLALLIYPWMTGSFGVLLFLALGMMAYYLVPDRYAKKFNEKIHKPILKFLGLREEDIDNWAHREVIWALGFILLLPILAWFSITRAYGTANEFADISQCPSLIMLWGAIIFGIDISTPECPPAKSALIFGGGIADLEMDKFYPLYTLAELTFYSLAILLTTFTPF